MIKLQRAISKLKQAADENKENSRASSKEPSVPLTTETNLIQKGYIEFTKVIGHGSFATVFKGLYKDENVAIKVFKYDSSLSSDFKKEYDVLR